MKIQPLYHRTPQRTMETSASNLSSSYAGIFVGNFQLNPGQRHHKSSRNTRRAHPPPPSFSLLGPRINRLGSCAAAIPARLESPRLLYRKLKRRVERPDRGGSRACIGTAYSYPAEEEPLAFSPLYDPRRAWCSRVQLRAKEGARFSRNIGTGLSPARGRTMHTEDPQEERKSVYRYICSQRPRPRAQPVLSTAAAAKSCPAIYSGSFFVPRGERGGGALSRLSIIFYAAARPRLLFLCPSLFIRDRPTSVSVYRLRGL